MKKDPSELQFEIDLETAIYCSQQGACDSYVADALDDPVVAALLDAYEPEAIRKHLAGYGAWDGADLADDDENRARFLWLACCDRAEEERGSR